MGKGKASPHRLLSEIQDFQEGVTAYVAGIAKDLEALMNFCSHMLKTLVVKKKIYALL